MNSNLQKGPDGLLGALDLKTTGKNPVGFPDALQGTFECTPFYLLRNRRSSSLTAAFAAINTTIVAHTVPQDEVWRIKAIGIVGVRAAADIGLTIEASVNQRRATGTALAAVFVSLFTPVAATDLIQQRGIITPDYWMGPGDRLSLQLATTVTIAGSSWSLYIDYDSMPSG